jgi:SAM-dependent methyltransferase
MVGDLTDRAVLDVGCGTGRVLDYAPNVSGYVGIDPSYARLKALRARHRHARLVWTTLPSLVPMWPTGITNGGPLDSVVQRRAKGESGDLRFDVVLALFGAGGARATRSWSVFPCCCGPVRHRPNSDVDIEWPSPAVCASSGHTGATTGAARLLSGEEMTARGPLVCRSRGRLGVGSFHFLDFVSRWPARSRRSRCSPDCPR